MPAVTSNAAAFGKPRMRPLRTGGRPRRGMVAGCLTACGVFATGVASAQGQPGATRDTGSLIPRISHPGSGLNPRVEEQPSDIALASSRRMVACAVKRGREQARGVLLADDNNGYVAAQKKMDRFLYDCAGDQAEAAEAGIRFRLKRYAYHGLVAEAWVKQTGMSGLEALPAAPAKAGPEWLLSYEDKVVLGKLATCIAYTQPHRAGAVVLAAPVSAEEGAAIQQVVPFLKPCIGERDVLRMDKTSPRLALAIALARRSVAAPAAIKAN